MQQADAESGQRLGQLGMGFDHIAEVERRRRAFFGTAFLDQRADPVDLRAARDFSLDLLDHVEAFAIGKDFGDDGGAAGRQLVDRRNVEVGEISHRQGARDRRGAHHQQMRLQLHRSQLLAQGQPLGHTEAVLLVDDGQTKAREADFLLDHRMGADHQLRLA